MSSEQPPNNINGTSTVPETTSSPSSDNAHPNDNPSLTSTRTSVTHVEHDEESRRPQGILQNLVTASATVAKPPPPPPPPPQQDAVNDTCNPTTLVEAPQGEIPIPSTSSTVPATPQQHNDGDEVSVPQTPQTYVTFLLISGRRRTMAFDADTTIGRVKELVWNSWPSDWQNERPSAPSFLRVLYLGRMLQDDETLSALKLLATSPSNPVPTIMHLSIRPSPPVGEGDSMKKKRRRGQSDSSVRNEANEAVSAGCCRCIVL